MLMPSKQRQSISAGLGLLCLMTPGLSKAFGVIYDHAVSKLVNHQIKRQATHKVGCEPGDLHMVMLIFFMGLCGYV